MADRDVDVEPTYRAMSTQMAADRVGVSEQAFPTWARRRRLRPRRYVRLGRSSYAIWALEDILAAQRARPDNR